MGTLNWHSKLATRNEVYGEGSLFTQGSGLALLSFPTTPGTSPTPAWGLSVMSPLQTGSQERLSSWDTCRLSLPPGVRRVPAEILVGDANANETQLLFCQVPTGPKMGMY